MAGKDLNVSFLLHLDPNSSWHMFIRGYIFHLVHEIFVVCKSRCFIPALERLVLLQVLFVPRLC